MRTFVAYKHMKKTDKKRCSIEEAIQLWSKSKTATEDDRCKFIDEIKKLGWKAIGYGAYKQCLVKNDIVIKFAPNPEYGEAAREVLREVEQWETAPQWLQRHLPNMYAFVKGLLVQEKVDKMCDHCCDCVKLNSLIDKHYGHLYDCYQNPSHFIIIFPSSLLPTSNNLVFLFIQAIIAN